MSEKRESTANLALLSILYLFFYKDVQTPGALLRSLSSHILFYYEKLKEIEKGEIKRRIETILKIKGRIETTQTTA